MIAALLGLFSNPARIGAAVVLAALLGLSGYLKIELTMREHAIASLQADSAAKDKTVGQLRQAVASDDAALKKYGDMAQAALAEQALASKRADEAARVAQTALAALKTAPIPRTCQGARKWSIATAASLEKGWSK